MSLPLKKILIVSAAAMLFNVTGRAFCAAGQILSDAFFQNPAELGLIDHTKLIAGNLYIVPEFKFVGTALAGSGSAVSKVNNSLPYLKTAYRMNDRWVVGVDVVPTTYGHIEWPMNSPVIQNSTKTQLIYYRGGVESSYQFTDKLTLGFGVNLEWNKNLELDFFRPGQGNEINKVSGLNNIVDLGFVYKIDPRNTLNASLFSGVNTNGSGTSSLGGQTVYGTSLTIVEAMLAHVGLQHMVTDEWLVEGRVYWSNWCIQKNFHLLNTVTGSYVLPTDWKNVWAFLLRNRYDVTDRLALTGSILYETNPAPVWTNAIAYPLSSILAGSAGVDVAIQKEISVQVKYEYATFLPRALINNEFANGNISARIQSILFQLSYKT